MFDVKKIRQDFPGLHTTVHDKPLIYFDNAATSHKPQSVIDAITRYYSTYTANVHRGVYYTSEVATREYELVREKIARFIKAPSQQQIIFTKGTTESINLVSYAWARRVLTPADEILVTEMEHHSNLVPWQMTAKDTRATIRYIPMTGEGELDLSDIDSLINQKTKLVAICHQSNVLGTINPLQKIIKMAHDVGAKVLVDAAQSVPHFLVDVQDLDCDFFAFSGHKMLGPTGVGVLYAKMDILESMDPFHGGGEMIDQVTMEHSTWNDIPYRFEAGTPNIAQVIGLGAAIDYLQSVGMEKIQSYNESLLNHMRSELDALRDVKIFGPNINRGPVVPFVIDGIHAADLTQFLDQYGIAVRAGHHCAQPLVRHFDLTSTIRASLYFYNTVDEINQFITSIQAIRKYF